MTKGGIIKRGNAARPLQQLVPTAVVVPALLQGPLLTVGIRGVFVALVVASCAVLVAVNVLRVFGKVETQGNYYQRLFVALVLAFTIMQLLNAQAIPNSSALLILGLLFLVTVLLEPLSREDFGLGLAVAWWVLLAGSVVSIAVLVLTGLTPATSLPASQGYDGAMALLTPTGFRWVSLWGGPLPTGTAGALLIIIGLVRNRGYWWVSLMVGVPVVVLSGNRTAALSALLGVSLVLMLSGQRWVRRLALGLLAGSIALLVAFGAITGFTGRLSLWSSLVPELWVRGSWFGFCPNLAMCLSMSPDAGQFPSWAVDAHNSLLQIWLQHGFFTLFLLIVIFVVAICGAILRLDREDLVRVSATSVPLIGYAMVAPIAHVGAWNFAILSMLLLGTYTTTREREIIY